MATKHTPGPWKWSEEERDCGFPNNPFSMVLRGPDTKAVLDAKAFHEDAWLNSDYDGEAAEANSLLIAAAPELLEALEVLHRKLVDRYDVDYPGENLAQYQPEVKLAEAAIRKAKGDRSRAPKEGTE